MAIERLLHRLGHPPKHQHKTHKQGRPPRPKPQDIMPSELWDRIFQYCDDRSFIAMLGVCRGMRDMPSRSTLRARIEDLDKKQDCPELPRDALTQRCRALARAEARLARMTRHGPALLLPHNVDFAWAPSFSPDGSFVILYRTNNLSPFGERSSRRTYLVDLRGKKPRTHPLPLFDGVRSNATFSPDSKRVLVAPDWAVTAAIFDLREDAPKLTISLSVRMGVNACFSHDGKMLLTADTKGVYLRHGVDNAEGSLTQCLTGDAMVSGIFSPNSKRLAYTNVPSEQCTQRVTIYNTDVYPAQRVDTVELEHRPCRRLRWSPNSTQLLMFQHNHPNLLWDCKERRFVSIPDAHWMTQSTPSPYRFRFGVADASPIVEDLRTKARHDPRSSYAHVQSPRVSPSGRFAVVTDFDKTFATHLYDLHASDKRPLMRRAKERAEVFLLGQFVNH